MTTPCGNSEVSRRAELFGLSERITRLARSRFRSPADHGAAILRWEKLPKAFSDRIADVRAGRWARRVDVLTTLVADLWRVDGTLEDFGITSECVNLVGRSQAAIEDAIFRYSPKIILDRNMALLPEVVDMLSIKYPKIQFVNGCHDSQAYLLRWPHHVERQTAYCRLARSRANCWYGTPDERNWLGKVYQCDRIIWLPNYVHLPPAAIKRSHSDPFVVGLSCRRDVVKNIHPQVIACAFAARHYPLRLLLNLRNQHHDIADFAESLGLTVDCVPWQEHVEFQRTIRDVVDIGMQASLAESFNYVAIDHLGFGIPVVGSPTLRYLPTCWQADPDDAESIAHVLASHCRLWSDRSREARQAAELLATRNNAAFVAMIRGILSKCP